MFFFLIIFSLFIIEAFWLNLNSFILIFLIIFFEIYNLVDILINSSLARECGLKSCSIWFNFLNFKLGIITIEKIQIVSHS